MISKLYDKAIVLLEFFNSISYSDYGSSASIVGFLFSTVTLFLVLGIKKKFLFRYRVDEHKDALTKIASKVSGFLEDFSKNIDEIDNSFALADVKLRNMQKGATNDLLSDIKITRKKIKKFKSKKSIITGKENKTDKAAREIRTELNKVVEELNNVSKEFMVGK